MTWLDFARPLLGGVSFTLGLIYLFVWSRQRNQPAMLAFAAAAGEVCALAIFEHLGGRSTSPAEYWRHLDWAEFVVVLIPPSLVAFVLLHFRAGRAWIGWAACAFRGASFLAAEATGTATRFLHVDALRQVELLGAPVAMPVGPPNPMMVLMLVADVLLIVFFASAILEVRRRTDPVQRQRATLVCGSMIAFVVAGSGSNTLIALGLLASPQMGMPPFSSCCW